VAPGHLTAISFASGTSLSLSPEKMRLFYEDLNFFRTRIVLRPQEITTSPEIARRLGVISINPALEVDFFGNVNSTHRTAGLDGTAACQSVRWTSQSTARGHSSF
jgi:acyl-CoA hydrolase